MTLALERPSRARRVREAEVRALLAALSAHGSLSREELAARMGTSDRRARLAVEAARRQGELVITTWDRPRRYRVARSRAEYGEWRRREVLSRIGSFRQELAALDAAAERQWGGGEQLRLEV